MSTAQLAAVSYRACYSGHTHSRTPTNSAAGSRHARTNQLDPLVGIQPARSPPALTVVVAVASARTYATSGNLDVGDVAEGADWGCVAYP